MFLKQHTVSEWGKNEKSKLLQKFVLKVMISTYLKVKMMPLKIQFAKNFTLFILEFLAPMLQDSDLSGSILFSQKLIRPMILKFKREISYCA